MSRLSIIAVITGLSVIAAGRAQAQTGPAAQQGKRDSVVAVGARELLDRKADLGLTDEQTHQLGAIARRYDDQDKLLRDETARAASRAAERKEAAGVLTDEQRARARERARKK
jgi:hypothetical protein